VETYPSLQDLIYTSRPQFSTNLQPVISKNSNLKAGRKDRELYSDELRSGVNEFFKSSDRFYCVARDETFNTLSERIAWLLIFNEIIEWQARIGHLAVSIRMVEDAEFSGRHSSRNQPAHGQDRQPGLLAVSGTIADTRVFEKVYKLILAIHQMG
jgi:hypothetical protein